MNRYVVPLVLSTLSLSALAVALPPVQDSFDEKKEQYEDFMRCLPLYMHTRGRIKFAQTTDPRALQILADSYSKPEDPEHVVRYLLAEITTRFCQQKKHIPIYDKWRKKHRKDEDAWLWARSLKINTKHNGPAECLEIVRGKKNDLFLRAAAIEALAAAGDAAVLDLIPEVIRSLPKKPYKKAVLVGALATALESRSEDVSAPKFQKAAVVFIHLLDDEYELEIDTKLVIARHLGKILDSDKLVIEAAPWIALLGDAGKKIETTNDYVKPKFFGVEASGSRIAYVIDMSDSMCKKIDPKIKPETPRSGPGEIPWNLVRTRFDLAREHLKISLRGLDKDKSFCVIGFGTKAELFDSCNGMIKASPGNIKKVIKELDSIDLASGTAERPDGVLRGNTNLHGGMARAFKVKKRGLAEEYSYIDLKVWAEGADTIFLLSDGTPSCDDYDMWDDRHPDSGYAAGDPETGASQDASAERMLYTGPYRDERNLVADLERLNMFRELEIHCIGIGEANMEFLKTVADVGLGSVTNVGN